MDTNELLVRTLNAAKEARERGFDKTAEAFDEIVESLLDLLDSRAQPTSEIQSESVTELQHFH